MPLRSIKTVHALWILSMVMTACGEAPGPPTASESSTEGPRNQVYPDLLQVIEDPLLEASLEALGGSSRPTTTCLQELAWEIRFGGSAWIPCPIVTIGPNQTPDEELYLEVVNLFLETVAEILQGARKSR